MDSADADNTEVFSCYVASGGVDRILRIWELSRFIDSFDFDRGDNPDEISENNDNRLSCDGRTADAPLDPTPYRKLNQGFTLRSLDSYLRGEAVSVDSGSSEEEGSDLGSENSIHIMKQIDNDS
jgi:hypothetical protein